MKLEDAAEQFNREYGKNTCISGDEVTGNRDRLPTGIFSLDWALNGGLPLGQITCFKGPEAGGKTSAAMNVAAVAEKICWRCMKLNCTCSTAPLRMRTLWADVEGRFDPEWAHDIGVTDGSYVIVTAEDLEQYADILAKSVEAEDCGLIVVDSIAALTPAKILDGSAYNNYMGVDPRAVTELVKRVNSGLIKESRNGHNVACVMINQLRYKIGEMFGCFHGDTMVVLSDGSSLPIREIVDNKLSVSVLSYDESQGTVSPHRVVAWHNNGAVENPEGFLWFKVKSVGKNIYQGMCCTPYHEVMTPSGWVRAKDLEIGDLVLSRVERRLTEDAEQVVYGSALGDGHIAIPNSNTGTLKITAKGQYDYIQWKISKIPLKFTVASHNRGIPVYSSELIYELYKISRMSEEELVGNLDWLGLAVWYMDDGHFYGNGFDRGKNGRYYKKSDSCNISIRRMSPELGTRIVHSLNTRLDLSATYVESKGAIMFGVDAAETLFNNICELVPPSMQYKLPPSYRGRYVDKQNYVRGVEHIIVNLPIVDKRNASSRQMRQKGKYDITVEGSHTYLVGDPNSGIIVHNSPETMPGGMALKHFSSLWIRFSKRALTDADKTMTDKERKLNKVQRHAFAVEKYTMSILAGGGDFVRCKEPIKEDGVVEFRKGEVIEYNTVMTQAKKYGVVSKDGNKWKIFDMVANTQKEIVEFWKGNQAAYMEAQQATIQAAGQEIFGCQQ